jgi:hypothetical protein
MLYLLNINLNIYLEKPMSEKHLITTINQELKAHTAMIIKYRSTLNQLSTTLVPQLIKNTSVQVKLT